MDTYTYNFSFTHLPPVFKRGRTVALALFQNHQLLLARKQIYPDNIHRIFGGGLEPNEMLTIAALRELQEETGIHLGPNKLNRMATFSFNLNETSTNQYFDYEIILFYIQVDGLEVKPADDVDTMTAYNQSQLKNLIQQMISLSSELIVSEKDHSSFRWSDWGQVFAIVHEYILTHWPVN